MLLLALAYCLGLASPVCYAGPDVQWQRYFDQTGALELPEVQNMPFAPASPYIQWNATPGALWLRFTLTDDGSEPLFLQWSRPTADQVTLYLPSGQGGAWRERALSGRELQTGARLGWGPAPYPVPFTFYVRLQSEGFHWIGPLVLTQSASLQQRDNALLLLSADVSLGLLVLVGAALQWVRTRRLAYAALMVMCATLLVLNLNLEGVFVQWLELAPYAFVLVSKVSGLFAVLASPLVVAALLTGTVDVAPSRRALRWYVGGGLVLVSLTPFAWRVVVFLLALSWIHLLYAYLVWQRYRTKGDAPFWHWARREDKLVALSAAVYTMLNAAVFLGSPWASGTAFETAYHVVFRGSVFTLFGLVILSRQDYLLHLQALAQAAAAQARDLIHAQWRATQQQFLAMLVHEIRTPLTVIQFASHAMAHRALDPAQKASWVQRMDGAVATIRQILENCIHADRVDAGVETIELQEFAIEPVLQTAIDRLQETNPEGVQRLMLGFEVAGLRQVRCVADPIFVGIILGNLLGNALKYSPPSTPVRLQVQLQQQNGQQWLALWVHNEVAAGGGPDPARVFERYYRAQSSGRVAGTGLGLWLSQNLAQRMQTQISFDQNGQRIRFGLVLLQAPALKAP